MVHYKQELRNHLVRYYIRHCENHSLTYDDWIVMPQMAMSKSANGHDANKIYMNCLLRPTTSIEQEWIEKEAEAISCMTA